jgi:hypothetical protein
MLAIPRHDEDDAVKNAADAQNSSASASDKTLVALMYKDLVLPPKSNLELFFTCLIYGWEDSNNFLKRLHNPSLQILYDDVLVFTMETAISNNTKDYTANEWNQFRLFSR